MTTKQRGRWGRALRQTGRQTHTETYTHRHRHACHTRMGAKQEGKRLTGDWSRDLNEGGLLSQYFLCLPENLDCRLFGNHTCSKGKAPKNNARQAHTHTHRHTHRHTHTHTPKYTHINEKKRVQAG